MGDYWSFLPYTYMFQIIVARAKIGMSMPQHETSPQVSIRLPIELDLRNPFSAIK